jgi:hypothetical protein
MRSFRAIVLLFDVIAGCSPPTPFATGYGIKPKHALYTCFLKFILLFMNTQIYIVFRKRESVRPSKHCRYDIPPERKFRPTFDDERDENEKYH